MANRISKLLLSLSPTSSQVKRYQASEVLQERSQAPAVSLGRSCLMKENVRILQNDILVDHVIKKFYVPSSNAKIWGP